MDFITLICTIVLGIVAVLAGIAVVVLTAFAIVGFVVWALTAMVTSLFKS